MYRKTDKAVTTYTQRGASSVVQCLHEVDGRIAATWIFAHYEQHTVRTVKAGVIVNVADVCQTNPQGTKRSDQVGGQPLWQAFRQPLEREGEREVEADKVPS